MKAKKGSKLARMFDNLEVGKPIKTNKQEHKESGKPSLRKILDKVQNDEFAMIDITKCNMTDLKTFILNVNESDHWNVYSGSMGIQTEKITKASYSSLTNSLQADFSLHALDEKTMTNVVAQAGMCAFLGAGIKALKAYILNFGLFVIYIREKKKKNKKKNSKNKPKKRGGGRAAPAKKQSFELNLNKNKSKSKEKIKNDSSDDIDISTGDKNNNSNRKESLSSNCMPRLLSDLDVEFEQSDDNDNNENENCNENNNCAPNISQEQRDEIPKAINDMMICLIDYIFKEAYVKCEADLKAFNDISQKALKVMFAQFIATQRFRLNRNMEKHVVRICNKLEKNVISKAKDYHKKKAWYEFAEQSKYECIKQVLTHQIISQEYQLDNFANDMNQYLTNLVHEQQIEWINLNFSQMKEINRKIDEIGAGMAEDSDNEDDDGGNKNDVADMQEPPKKRQRVG